MFIKVSGTKRHSSNFTVSLNKAQGTHAKLTHAHSHILPSLLMPVHMLMRPEMVLNQVHCTCVPVYVHPFVHTSHDVVSPSSCFAVTESRHAQASHA